MQKNDYFQNYEKKEDLFYARLRELDKDLDEETESLEQIKLLETTNSIIGSPTELY